MFRMNDEFAETLSSIIAISPQQSSLRDWEVFRRFSMTGVQGSRAFPAKSRVRAAATGKSSQRYPHPLSTPFSHGAFFSLFLFRVPTHVKQLQPFAEVELLNWGAYGIGCEPLNSTLHDPAPSIRSKRKPVSYCSVSYRVYAPLLFSFSFFSFSLRCVGEHAPFSLTNISGSLSNGSIARVSVPSKFIADYQQIRNII